VASGPNYIVLIEDICRIVKHTSQWSNYSRLFKQLQSCNLPADVHMFLPMCLLLGPSSHNATHMMELIIVNGDHVMRSNCMPF